MTKPSHNHQQLQQIIVGLTDGIIFLGTDRKILWANDAALAMHGVRSLKELGATVGEYCRRFRLRYRNNRPVERGRYPMERLLSGDKFSDLVVEVTRAGTPEQNWFHSLRSLVITDEAGSTDYLVLIIKDETERFKAEERFESAFNANPAPALICRVSDLRYLRANPGFLQMTGYERKNLIGKSFHQIDVLTDAQNRALALERLKEGRTIPQMESCVPLPNGGIKYVIVAGEPILIADESCILFTFADLDPRKKVEDALRQSEERFSKSFRLSPVPTVIWRAEGLRFLEINEAFKTTFGYAEDEVVGKDAAALKLWSDPTAQTELERALERNGSIRNLDLQMRTKDGGIVDCLVSADSITLNDEACILCILHDITERKRSEDELVAAIEAVMADTSWFSRSVVEKLATLRQVARPRAATAGLHALTDRERDVLGLICEGLTDAEMSKALKLSPHTIRNHVFSLYRKIGVNRRSAAIIWGRERGITGRDALKPRQPRPTDGRKA